MGLLVTDGARLSLLATEKQVLVECVNSSLNDKACDFLLHSAEDGFIYQLPPLHAGFGFPPGCECIFLDGKVYTFGGEKLDGFRGDEVFVMDLTGRTKWTQCKSMPFAKHLTWCFGVVVRGKIYMCNAEKLYDDVIHVYDPASDTWSQVRIEPGAKPSDAVPGFLDAFNARRNLQRRSWELL